MTSYDEEQSGPDFTPACGGPTSRSPPAGVCGCTGVGTSAGGGGVV